MMLASGCSIAHGQGIFDECYHKNNISTSYPNLVATRIGIDCNNISYPGYSNEMIFHSTMKELNKRKYSHCLVSWTSNSRDGWENDNEIYTFNLNYARYDNKQKTKLDLFQEYRNNIVYTTTDVLNTSLDDLEKIYSAIKVKILTQDELDKVKNYQSAIKSFCKLYNIHLVQIDAIKNVDDSSFYLLDSKLFYNSAGPNKHPPQQSHDYWAKDIYEKFYE